MQKGLGKGLGALISTYDNYSLETKNVSRETKDVFKEITEGDVINKVPLYLIDANPNQPRKRFDDAAIEELASSIKQHGVISPIILTKNGERYMIIAGERRFRASKQAGLIDIPAIVKNYTEKEIKEVSLIENLQREDLNAVESARAIKTLMVEYKWTQEQVADRIGKSRPMVANLLRILTLPKSILKLVENDNLSAAHARTLVVLPNEREQELMADKAKDGKMSVRELEKAVQFVINPPKKEVKLEQSVELKDLANNLKRVFATKVSVFGNDNKGRIFIDYYNRDDLDRICEILKKIK